MFCGRAVSLVGLYEHLLITEEQNNLCVPLGGLVLFPDSLLYKFWSETSKIPPLLM